MDLVVVEPHALVICARPFERDVRRERTRVRHVIEFHRPLTSAEAGIALAGNLMKLERHPIVPRRRATRDLGQSGKIPPVVALALLQRRSTVTSKEGCFGPAVERSEEHTSELQSLMRISY